MKSTGLIILSWQPVEGSFPAHPPPACFFLCGRRCGEVWGQKGQEQVGGVTVSPEKKPGPVLAWLQLRTCPKILGGGALQLLPGSRVHQEQVARASPHRALKEQNPLVERIVCSSFLSPETFLGSRLLSTATRSWQRCVWWGGGRGRAGSQMVLRSV